MDHLLGLGPRRVVAMLGPTNTGKTHNAIERMLRHRTGMIGLPLRLLAREVYDRVVAQVGEGAVALVTGEEKRTPSTARFWVCTVEAMPMERAVHFLAIDEIQLAGDRVRGHVFTDRLLHARGLMETWFMGSDSAASLVLDLVPDAELERRPRLSTLRHAGMSYLTDLPPRSAVVAFSAREVTALAERLRDRRGGAAVVLGALSPRTRNAQVALFQSGEVPYLVATDAIGMGLNLDVHHVALAGLSKFDGISRRALSAAEVGQIAGRAGRYTQGGTFGTTEQVGELEPELVRRIEKHDFERLQRAYWRSPDLDFGSVDALLHSLDAKAPHRRLVRVKDSGDEEALRVLAGDDAIRRRAVGEGRVRLLWDVCRVPDFRKTLTGDHTDLLRVLYLSLCDRGHIRPEFADRRLSRLDRSDGGVGALTTRIAFVRTWATLSHRRGWFEDARHWQERAAAIEERLSDALHDELTHRFVERRNRHGWTPKLSGSSVEVAGTQVGGIVGLRLVAAGLTGAQAQAVRAAAAPALRERAEAVIAAKDAALSIGADRLIRHDDEPIAHLVRGDHPLSPEVEVDSAALPRPVVERVRERLLWWVRAQVDGLLAPLRSPAVLALGPEESRAFARAVDELGVLRKLAHVDAFGALTKTQWWTLHDAGLSEYRGLVWLNHMHIRGWTRWRAALARTYWPGLPDIGPGESPVRVDVGEGADADAWERLGYAIRGRYAVRLDRLRIR
ncbi:MAG: hypothetical protein KC912_15770 [Proteobacteria bacterium]|nr:hypothetical protein [Pseudomonadota bacterium]